MLTDKGWVFFAVLVAFGAKLFEIELIEISPSSL
jgi:hypothetical protein